eukprot:TRINITY_DN7865_c0_g1_i6.p1 TRINITY_DN7865_c0_g1~~TRINITY_DN7865_c0_g1_i6.p1  ORF type:complete len:568 (-),score=143.37 TRINITY_DN7865_c0_g1_i6:166-1869(-)
MHRYWTWLLHAGLVAADLRGLLAIDLAEEALGDTADRFVSLGDPFNDCSEAHSRIAASQVTGKDPAACFRSCALVASRYFSVNGAGACHCCAEVGDIDEDASRSAYRLSEEDHAHQVGFSETGSVESFASLSAAKAGFSETGSTESVTSLTDDHSVATAQPAAKGSDGKQADEDGLMDEAEWTKAAKQQLLDEANESDGIQDQEEKSKEAARKLHHKARSKQAGKKQPQAVSKESAWEKHHKAKLKKSVHEQQQKGKSNEAALEQKQEAKSKESSQERHHEAKSKEAPREKHHEAKSKEAPREKHHEVKSKEPSRDRQHEANSKEFRAAEVQEEKWNDVAKSSLIGSSSTQDKEKAPKREQRKDTPREPVRKQHWEAPPIGYAGTSQADLSETSSREKSAARGSRKAKSKELARDREERREAKSKEPARDREERREAKSKEPARDREERHEAKSKEPARDRKERREAKSREPSRERDERREAKSREASRERDERREAKSREASRERDERREADSSERSSREKSAARGSHEADSSDRSSRGKSADRGTDEADLSDLSRKFEPGEICSP